MAWSRVAAGTPTGVTVGVLEVWVGAEHARRLLVPSVLRAACAPGGSGCSGRLEYRLYLDGKPEGESGDPHGRSGGSTDGVAEGAHQEVCCAVGDQVLLGEPRRGADEDHHLHDTGHRRQRPKLGSDRRQEIQHHRLRGEATILGAQVRTETAGVHWCAAVKRSVAGQEHQRAGAHCHDIVRDRGVDFRQCEAGLLERLLRCHGWIGIES
jgi:hypothetical protein